MLSIILSVFVFCFVLERIIPGWRLPKVRTWPLRQSCRRPVPLPYRTGAQFDRFRCNDRRLRALLLT